MPSNFRIKLCLVTIVTLVVAQGGLLWGAGVGNEELVKQLRSDIDLILGLSGVIITALVTTIGILWRALRSSQNEFIETLKSLKNDE
jgi:hypothetical protein